MKLKFLILVLVVASLAPPVVAQEATGSANETGESPVTVDVLDDDGREGCTEHLDSRVSLCSARLDGDEAVLVFYSNATETATLSDAGAFIEGGVVRQKTFYLRDDVKTRVRFPVTVADNGFSGVGIATRRVTYAKPLKQPKEAFLPGRPSSIDPAVAGSTVFALFVVCLPLSVVAIRRFRGGVHDEF